MSVKSWDLHSDCVDLTVLEVGGQMGPVRFRHDGRKLEPMHIAPWSGDEGADPLPMLRWLRGDFLCAPFGANDLLTEETRDHGLPANGSWRPLQRSPRRLELQLEGSVSGARVRKEIRLRQGQPVVYQRHTLEGGAGRLPLGHHAMLGAPEGERLNLSFAPFSWGGTPPEPVERDPTLGRSRLRYPQRFDSLENVATANSGSIDLSSYPAVEDSEEIVMLVTDPRQPYAWSAAVAPQTGWLWFSLRPNGPLHSTMLWMSNGGRHYPPFSRRHRRVIGIEEVTSYFHLGHRASLEPNELTRLGIPTAVELEPAETVEIRYAFGAVPVPTGFERVATVEVKGDAIYFADGGGREIRVPFEGSFLDVDLA